MRHRVHGRKLGRTPAHRKALFRNQLTALFTHERIITTVAKAKELRPIAERMVTIARTGTLAARRKVATMVPDKETARRLFEDIAPRFADRPGGYTRIMRLGRRRGDNAELAIIEFVDYELADHTETGDGDRKTSLMDRAKGVFGGGAKAGEAEPETEESTAAEVDGVEELDEPEPGVDDHGAEGSSDDEATDATKEFVREDVAATDGEQEPAGSDEPGDEESTDATKDFVSEDATATDDQAAAEDAGDGSESDDQKAKG
jgi:large subunit ribosomal protein L17